jgi:hypothetical protein
MERMHSQRLKMLTELWISMNKGCISNETWKLCATVMILDLKGVLALFFPANDVNGFSSHDMVDNQSYINITCFIMERQ